VRQAARPEADGGAIFTSGVLMIHRYLLPAAVAAAACGGGDRNPPAPALPAPVPEAPAPTAPRALPDALLRGTVHLEPSLTFRSCETRTIVTALDSTGSRLVSTYRLMQASNQPGMYLLARGATAGNGADILREIEYASVPSATEGCDQSPPSGEIAARGVNPDWGLVISGSGIQFSRTTEPTSIVFPAVTPSGTAGVIRYEVPGGSGVPHTLQLDLSKAACNVGTKFTYAAMQASLMIDGKPLRGCAWRTRLP
jgi:uncharacterized membrane protein